MISAAKLFKISTTSSEAINKQSMYNLQFVLVERLVPGDGMPEVIRSGG